MTTSQADPQAAPLEAAGDAEALEHLHRAVEGGTHWFTALLEAIALWQSSEETYDHRTYRYLIGGEAFDWLLLAERLCDELGDIVSPADKEALLFHGRFPVDVSPWEFQHVIGRAKYRGYLNYWYGVLVEEAIVLAVEERMSKDKMSVGLGGIGADPELVYERIYGTPRSELLAQFQNERELPLSTDVPLAQFREFTYWCFKYRLEHADPAKVASDTRLGLQQLQRMQTKRRLSVPVALS